jgi:predicted secreted protein
MPILRGFAGDSRRTHELLQSTRRVPEQSIMKSSIRVAPSALCIASFALVSPTHAQVAAPLGVLGLTSSATVEVQKDLLAVTLAMSKEGSDANVVQAQLKQALDAALAEAKKAARPGQLDVQTGNFSLYPRYSNPSSSASPTITGWQGTAEIVVEGRDMAAIGQLTGRITTMTIARVAYRLSREAGQKIEGEIVAEAIAAFRVNATSYAKQFGYGGFEVREVNVATSEPQDGPVPMMRMKAAASSQGDALPVEPGKATVTATVSGTIQLK